MSHPALTHLPHGWFHHGEQMLALLEQHKPQVVVELGTHNGQSAVAMARVLKDWGGTLYCVDTWCGVPKVTKRQPFRLFTCAMNLIIAGVNPHVRLVPSKTGDAAKAWHGPAIDCLYIDADHSYEGCKADLEQWVPHVRSGGLIAGDDYDHPHYPGVNQAWDEFGRAQGIALQRVLTPNTKPEGMSLVYGVKP